MTISDSGGAEPGADPGADPVTRHLLWCCERALEELDAGAPHLAVASLFSDAGKCGADGKGHAELRSRYDLGVLSAAFATGDRPAVQAAMAAIGLPASVPGAPWNG